MSNNNYHPKTMMIENCGFSELGRGNWLSCTEGVTEGVQWARTPWEVLAVDDLDKRAVPEIATLKVRSLKVSPGDLLTPGHVIESRSSSDLSGIHTCSYDMVVTDPPFGGLVHYSELSDFFYSWMRLPLKDRYPAQFGPEQTPKALEAVTNKARNPDDHDAFYQKLLTQCWREAARILKPSGVLAFTFHHSEDEPWVAVLESLFDAGFYLEATYPIRSDETKGEGEFGSKLVEYDIIHVCRKRTEEPTEVSWARLRRQINQDVRQLQDILTKHQSAGLQEADLQVIRRGKALEYYSKHYGKVYVERGREFTVREALLAINQLLDDQADTTTEPPPVLAEPYTRQFFRLFADKTSEKRDQIQKYLRGTGVSPQEFIDRGWCWEKAKVFTSISPLEWAQSLRGIRRDAIGRDFDQVMLMVGACCEGSGIKLSDTLVTSFNTQQEGEMFNLTSLAANAHEAQGHRFDPDLHFIECSRDAWTTRWLEAMVQKYDASIVAHCLDEDPATGMVNLELQFGKDRDCREATWKCQKEYEKGSPKRPPVGYAQPRLHQRLHKGRFYRLPDGQAFLLLGKWDSHGNRWGKVQVGAMTSDGMIPLRNEIVPEEVLRRCPVIPQEQEPFSSEQFTQRGEP
jgi:hypothetical protein